MVTITEFDNLCKIFLFSLALNKYGAKLFDIETCITYPLIGNFLPVIPREPQGISNIKYTTVHPLLNWSHSKCVNNVIFFHNCITDSRTKKPIFANREFAKFLKSPYFNFLIFVLHSLRENLFNYSLFLRQKFYKECNSFTFLQSTAFIK